MLFHRPSVVPLDHIEQAAAFGVSLAQIAHSQQHGPSLLISSTSPISTGPTGYYPTDPTNP
jgi:hypothetical protein